MISMICICYFMNSHLRGFCLCDIKISPKLEILILCNIGLLAGSNVCDILLLVKIPKTCYHVSSYNQSHDVNSSYNRLNRKPNILFKTI